MSDRKSAWSSRFTGLRCSDCKTKYRPIPINVCKCGKPLLGEYDLKGLRKDELAERPDLWRWSPLLPVAKVGNIVSLGEGGTQLRHLQILGKRLGVERLYVKDEGSNPTGTFKARGMAVAVSKAKELGIRKVAVATTGSAGSALAAYAHKAGLKSFIVFAKGAARNHIRLARHLGARVKTCRGYMNDAIAEVESLCADRGYFNVATMKEPYRLEGKKTIALEVADGLGDFPDVMVFPVGGGTGIIAAWKAWLELKRIGWYRTRPRLFFVQAKGCAPVFKAWREGAPTCDLWKKVETRVPGLAVPKPFADSLILRAVRETGGGGATVSDEEMRTAAKQFLRCEGVSACLEGAATLAGARHLVKQGLIWNDETVLLINTGTGIAIH